MSQWYRMQNKVSFFKVFHLKCSILTILNIKNKVKPAIRWPHIKQTRASVNPRFPFFSIKRTKERVTVLFPVPRFPDSSFSVSLFRVTFLYDRARVRRVSAQRRYDYFFNKCKKLFFPFFSYLKLFLEYGQPMAPSASLKWLPRFSTSQTDLHPECYRMYTIHSQSHNHLNSDKKNSASC